VLPDSETLANSPNRRHRAKVCERIVASAGKYRIRVGSNHLISVGAIKPIRPAGPTSFDHIRRSAAEGEEPFAVSEDGQCQIGNDVNLKLLSREGACSRSERPYESVCTRRICDAAQTVHINAGQQQHWSLQVPRFAQREFPASCSPSGTRNSGRCRRVVAAGHRACGLGCRRSPR